MRKCASELCQETTVHSQVKTLENIPPIQAAVKLHIRHICCQANCWNKAHWSHILICQSLLTGVGQRKLMVAAFLDHSS